MAFSVIYTNVSRFIVVSLPDTMYGSYLPMFIFLFFFIQLFSAVASAVANTMML